MARAELAQMPSFMSQFSQVISNHTNKTLLIERIISEPSPHQHMPAESLHIPLDIDFQPLVILSARSRFEM